MTNIFAVKISKVEVTDITAILQAYCHRLPQIAVKNGRLWWKLVEQRLQILQTYCRHIATDCRRLQWKTANCSGRCHRVCPITLKGVRS